MNVEAEIDAHFKNLASEYPLAKHPFFDYLKRLPADRLTPTVLGKLYLNYQGAMHASRECVYLTRPGIPEARATLAEIILVDDAPGKGKMTHHELLEKTFRNLGADIPSPDNRFDDLEDVLIPQLEPGVQKFVRQCVKLYDRNSGAFATVELLSNEWLHAFGDALQPHFPNIKREPYFKEMFEEGIEIEHSRLAQAMLKTIVRRFPDRLDITLQASRDMAKSVWDLWSSLQRLLV